MSLKQSRSDKNDSQYRKFGGGPSGRSSQQSAFSGRGGKGSGGGGTTATPLANYRSSSLSANRSFQKANNAPGGHSRTSVGSDSTSKSNAVSAARAVQNGMHGLPLLHGTYDAQVPAAVSTHTDTSTQKSTRPIPRAPYSQATAMNADSIAPTTPAKAPGEAARGFPVQFGSISPGFMNGMQIPARTSSAPPNLDEEKHNQAQHDSLKSVPVVPIPSFTKSQLPRKDATSVDQTATVSNTNFLKTKKDSQVTSSCSGTQSWKPSILPTVGMSMPMHYYPLSGPLQFAGPNSQTQSQSMQGTLLPMPIVPLQMGNGPQMQQQVFFPSIQHHLVQSQRNMHEGQGLGFSPHMVPQLPHHLGNVGMNLSPQFAQHQNGKIDSNRKAVKITDPKTHEELRLDKRADVCTDDGSAGSRLHHSFPPQSRPLPAFATTPLGYYVNSYNGGTPIFLPPSSLPLVGTQLSSSGQVTGFNSLVSQAPPNVTFMNPFPFKSLSIDNVETSAHGPGEPTTLGHPLDAQRIISSPQSTTIPVTIKPVAGFARESVIDSNIAEKGDLPELLRLPGSSYVQKNSEMSSENASLLSSSVFEQSQESPASVASESPTPGTAYSIPTSAPGEPALIVSDVDHRGMEIAGKMAGKTGHSQPLHQVDGQSDTSLPAQAADCSDSSKIRPSEPLETRTDHALPAVSEHDTHAATTDVCGPVDGFLESATCSSPVIHGMRIIRNTGGKDDIPLQEGTLQKSVGPGEHGEKEHNGHLMPDIDLNNGPTSNSLKDAEVEKTTQDAGVGVVGTFQSDDQSTTHAEVDWRPADTSTSVQVPSIATDGHNMSLSNASLSRIDSMSCNEDHTKSGISHSEMATVPVNPSEENSRYEGEAIECTRPTFSSGPVSCSNGGFSDSNKNTVSRGKKKRKEFFQKADAAGTTLDLYVAYKATEEKKETAIIAENPGRTSDDDLKQIPPDISHEDATAEDKDEPVKAEIDDWEDAADISPPKLESSSNEECGETAHISQAVIPKMYSRDFLLTLSEHCTDLPEGFEVTSDVADVLLRTNVNTSHVFDREYPSPGGNVDKEFGLPRVDRHASGIIDTDRFGKPLGPFSSGRDMGSDLGYRGNMIGFRAGQGSSYGILRNLRAQAPAQYAGVTLSGPMQSLSSQGGIYRNNSDSDRWLRGTNFQKGLMPPPQTPSRVMHKADKKYEVGKVTDEEAAKQRQLKAILNKLTPQNFEKLFEQVKEVNIDNAVTLTGAISQIFDKALMEPTFCEMYASFCYCLASELPEISVDNERVTFKRLLLKKCQEEFERGEREQEEANKADGEGESKQSEVEREEKRLKARRRMLGNIRLIGELYKKRMLTERIMHEECIKSLLGQYQNPDEENIEALCKLMSTIGEMIDHPKAKEHMDAYFDIVMKLSNNMKLSSRVRFMLKDVIDLRKNKWQQRRKVEGPKKIEEVHRNALQERQAQASRLTRGLSMNSSMRRGQPLDLGPRGSTMHSSPVGQIGEFRGLSTQVCRNGAQDVRLEDRRSFENQTLPVTLTYSLRDNNSITFGPQGGLAKGMSIRGPPTISNEPSDRRMGGAFNGHISVPECVAYGSREELLSRFPSENFAVPGSYEQSTGPDLNLGYAKRDCHNPDHNNDRPVPTSPPLPLWEMPIVENLSSEKVWPEELLWGMSIAAIKEFYSANDEKEVVRCIKDLNAPSVYPSVISTWVTDSFERKDMERDMLAKLLVDLTKPRDGTFTPIQLIEGFESVLANLEDTVNDAPKAAEFLGRLFARVIVENLVSLEEVGRSIYAGGEEPGRLREVGLAADVLASILESIKLDSGDSQLNEICAASNLRLEDFRPPNALRPGKLEMFI